LILEVAEFRIHAGERSAFEAAMT